MGIPGAWKFLRSHRPETFLSSVNTRTTDHVLLDLNPLLHRLSPYEPVAPHRPVIQHLNTFLLKTLRARKSVFLCLDGPSALAKLPVQRRRRQQTVLRAERIRVPFDVCQLTPGTAFMSDLEERLRETCQRLERELGVPVSLSTSNDPGEGEIKMLHRMARLPVESNDTISLVTSDSDIIGQVLCSPHLEGVSIHGSHLPGPFSPHAFVQGLIKEIGLTKSGDEATLDLVARDFSLLILLCGNDAFPGLSPFSFPRLMQTFVRWRMDAKRGIVFGQTDRPTIHWETLAEFLDHLPYRTTPLQPFAQSLAFLGGLQTLFSVQSFHIHSTISRSSVLQKDVIPYFLSAHDRIPLSNTASLLSVLGQSQEMTAFESSMKAKPSLPAALPDITSEFCALLMLPSSKHNLLLNPSQDLLSFHSEADKALQAYSLSETGTTESGLSDLVQRLWSTYQSLSRALPKSE